MFPPVDSLIIFTREIGECLFIQHGIATIIAAKSIGDYCWINQQVTIGYSLENESPILGNGVRVAAGAKVIGQIYLEDNCIIGTNAVVIKDVRNREIIGGVPGKLIGYNNDYTLYS